LGFVRIYAVFSPFSFFRLFLIKKRLNALFLGFSRLLSLVFNRNGCFFLPLFFLTFQGFKPLFLFILIGFLCFFAFFFFLTVFGLKANKINAFKRFF